MTLEDIQRARRAVKGLAHCTPLSFSSTVSNATGASVYLKCENLQRTGSFKIRGASNRLAALTAVERKRGVVTASAGNHAQGVALAASVLKIPATVFMPENTPLAKVAATQGYGAEIRLEGAGYDEAYDAAVGFQRSTGRAFIHPFNDELVMAGQGTVALEIMEQLPDVDVVIVPVGGGGLIAGIATAAKALKPGVRVIGVQAAGASAFVESLSVGCPQTLSSVSTIADGIAVRRPGDLAFDVVRRLVDSVVTVEEEMISHAIVVLLERAKLVVEAAGAVSVAALLSGRVEVAGQQVVAVLSGGNIDINLMARIIEHGLAAAGRYLVFETWLPDRPGELIKLLQPLVEERVNILAIEHRRPVSFPEVEVMLTVETRDFDHGDHLLATLRKRGYQVARIETAKKKEATPSP